LPEAKRPALDKIVKDEAGSDPAQSAPFPSGDAPKLEEHALPPLPDMNGTAEVKIDTSLPTTNGAGVATNAQPIPSTTSQGVTSDDSQSGPSQDETNWVHIRAVISSSEAATCIGKGGENVTQIRKLSGAKCTVRCRCKGWPRPS
jgi:poly(rC)-binding protein 2/3/4